MNEFPFHALRRWPDVEAPDLVAADAADRLLVHVAEHELSKRERSDWLATHSISVIGDNYGAVTLGLLGALGTPASGVRVHQDAKSGEEALASNAKIVQSLVEQPLGSFENVGLGRELVDDARLVLLRLPKSLDQVDEWTATIAAYAHDDVIVLAGGRDKYMPASMTAVLERYFSEVSVGRGSQKSRVVTARGPRRAEAMRGLGEWPRRATEEIVSAGSNSSLEVHAFGGAFAGASVDIGTRVLIDVLDRAPGKQNQRIIDFGCGTGVLAVQLARLRPTATIIATDQSEASVRSARSTVDANGVADRVTVVRDDGLQAQRDASVDLIVFNPPFHSGAAVHADTSLRLFAEAGRVLKPGGELWVVANRHLSYRPALRRLVGSTRMIKQTPKFTVTASIKDGGANDAQRRERRKSTSPQGLPNEPRIR